MRNIATTRGYAVGLLVFLPDKKRRKNRIATRSRKGAAMMAVPFTISKGAAIMAVPFTGGLLLNQQNVSDDRLHPRGSKMQPIRACTMVLAWEMASRRHFGARALCGLGRR